jgi:hypothetical protein
MRDRTATVPPTPTPLHILLSLHASSLTSFFLFLPCILHSNHSAREVEVPEEGGMGRVLALLERNETAVL